MKIFAILFILSGTVCFAGTDMNEFDRVIQSIRHEKLKADPALIRNLKLQIHSQNYNNEADTNKLAIIADINGNISEASGGTNLTGYPVNLLKYDNSQQQFLSLSSTTTDSNGDYTFNISDSGIYSISIGQPNDNDNYFSYVWNASTNSQQICSGCQLDTNIHGLDLNTNTTINNIDFILESGGTIEGNIVDADTLSPVTTLVVNLYDVDDVDHGGSPYRMSPHINSATGDYIFKGVPDGNYIAYLYPIDDTNMHIPEIFGGPSCNYCFNMVRNGQGNVIIISGANTHSGTDFTVNLGSSISGSLISQVNLLPQYEKGAVYLFDELNQIAAIRMIYGNQSGPLATDGSFFFGGLLKGSYYLQGGDLGTSFYQRELFDNIPCPYSGCDRRNGTPVYLGPQENIIGRDIRLDIGGKIDGYIVDANTGGPLNTIDFAPVEFQVYDSNGNVAGGGKVIEPATGYFELSRAIAPGQYKLRSGNMFNGEFNEPYVEELSRDEVCPGNSCDLIGQGDPIQVGVELVTEIPPLELSTGNSFSGLITELNSANPISDFYVLAYTASNPPKFAAWSQTDQNGSFTIYGLPDGDYYLLTNNGSNLPFQGIHGGNSSGWIDILYNGIACPGGSCDFTTGDIITLPLSPPPSPYSAVKGSNPDINMTLERGATISGQVTNFEAGAPIADVIVNIYDNFGVLISSHTTDSLGNYKSSGLPAGSYYMTTNSIEVIVDEIYGGGYCFETSCDPLSGTPIVLSPQQNAIEYDFSLRQDFIFSNNLD